VCATSHARVGGRAEVIVDGRIEVLRGLGRARVRPAPAGPLRSSQLEASRGHAGDATPACASVVIEVTEANFGFGLLFKGALQLLINRYG